MRLRGWTEPSQAAGPAALAALIACLLAVAPAGAATPSPTPSAKELWQTYPLSASPEPTRSAQPARTAAAHTPPAHARDGGGGGGTSLFERALQIGAVLVAALAVLTLWLWRRRRQPAEAAEAPEPPRAPRELEPPDPGAEWTAEIVWIKRGPMATFRAVARQGAQAEAVLAESEPVRWPPKGAEAVAAVSAAAEALGARLKSAGWTSLGVGDTWYARRFAWHADPVVAPAARTRRFRPVDEWPVEEYALWRCELEPVTDGPEPWLQAIVYPPGKRGGRVIASGREAAQLRAALRDVGWDPVAEGARLRFARFVWRGDPPPATRLDLHTPETSEAP